MHEIRIATPLKHTCDASRRIATQISSSVAILRWRVTILPSGVAICRILATPLRREAELGCQAAIVLASAELFTALKLIGAAYLVWIGLRTFQSACREASAISVRRTGVLRK